MPSVADDMQVKQRSRLFDKVRRTLVCLLALAAVACNGGGQDPSTPLPIAQAAVETSLSNPAAPTATSALNPAENTALRPDATPIADSGCFALEPYYEGDDRGITIFWNEPESGFLSLALRTTDSARWNIYYGGHSPGRARVAFDEFELSGPEDLAGIFLAYADDGTHVASYPDLMIELPNPARVDGSAGDSSRTKPRHSISTDCRPTDPTTPNDLTRIRPEDIADTEAGGMTDSIEIEGGHDPFESASFPAEREPVADEPLAVVPIGATVPDARFELHPWGIYLKWTDPGDSGFSLVMKTAGSEDWDIYYGGHGGDGAEVDFGEFGLTGWETLVGYFVEYGLDGHWIADHPEFTIDLSSLEFPDSPSAG